VRILGIDPGSISAAAALLTPDKAVVFDVPVVSKNINAGEFARLVRVLNPTCAVIESVSAFPGQGISSAFNFGRGFGTLIGVVQALGIELHFVSPVRWKNHFKLAGKRDDKDAGRQLATQLYPSVTGLELKKHGGRADALLLARYYSETSNRAAA
jgi:crossover junction endodeoxyribonuclease RuvC